MNDTLARFIEAACVPLDSGHASGTLQRAQEILSAHPELAIGSIHASAILGDEAGVRRFLDLNGGNATAKGGPRHWDALTHLCFSRYLRLDRSRDDGFVKAAEALLDAGASANTGFYSDDHQPPEFESVLYGAAGVAHHAAVTSLLLERGADPNDGEVVYHTPETDDNAVLKLLLDSRQLTADSLATMLLRKHDWHDRDGIKLLLEHRADARRMTRWGYSALHQAIRRDNDLEIVELLLDHGADPRLPSADGRSAPALAARAGRGDVLDLFARRGIPIALDGLDRLLAACARNDPNEIRSLVALRPELLHQLTRHAGRFLGKFAGIGNTEGVRHLLDLGADVAAVDEVGDGYWGIAKKSTALHVAAWRARHATVKLLVERGAPVDAQDEKGRTPLMLAVRACVDSYWCHRRSPESVAALLAAGASVQNVAYASGYNDVDDLLQGHQR
jgi:ankyrin repeat protein